MKTELEESAENYSENWEEINSSLSFDYMTPIEVSKLDFFNGAKWMQERMYSEEDMREAILFGSYGMYGYQWGKEGETENQISKYLKEFKTK
jgi:hypothetical protein